MFPEETYTNKIRGFEMKQDNEKYWLVELIEDYDYIERCNDCDGVGHLGRHSNGKLISCESCGGHEDALGKGFILNDVKQLAQAIRQQIEERLLSEEGIEKIVFKTSGSLLQQACQRVAKAIHNQVKDRLLK